MNFLDIIKVSQQPEFMSGIIPNATELINWFINFLGPTFCVVGVCVCVFAETGLLFGFFLPGDSLLFILGVFIGTNQIKVSIILITILIPLCAILGVQSGYWIGRLFGEKAFKKFNSKFFKKKYADNAKNFYKKHGAPAVFLSQFIPILRTFSPVVAGIGKMKYIKFALYNVGASIVWGATFPLLGIKFGKYEFVKHNIDVITILIIFISILPVIIKAINSKLSKSKKTTNE